MSRLSARMRTHRSAIASALLVLLWLGAGTALALWFSGRIRDWSVMTDELEYAKLATAIADTHSPLPTLHDTRVQVLNQLYPLLIAPLFGELSPPSAFRAAHVLNALVMASAAFPAYLLGRQVLSRPWSLAVALLSVLVPWMVLTGFLMTEAAAYPAFLWAILGLQLAVLGPSPRRDLLAVGALGLAVLARTQFAVLVLVLPLAILGHELGLALVSADSGPPARRLAVGAVTAVRRHRLLACLYAAGAAAAAIVALVGTIGSLLGAYSVTLGHGSVLPSGVWSAAAKHIDTVGIGCGLVPLLLGVGWMLSAIVRPRSPREHALATLFLLTVVALTVETASYDLRFGGGAVRGRYLFYIVPLLLVGSAAALAPGTRRQIAIGVALVTIFFSATAPGLAFTTFPGLWVDSPTSVLNGLLIDESGALGTGAFVALAGLLLGIVLVLSILLAPGRALALAVFAGLLAFSIVTLRAEANRVLTSTGLSGRPLARPSGLVLDWVDAVLPKGAKAAMIPFPISTAWDTTATRWWDVEFWNRSIVQNYVAGDGNFSYTPFPPRRLAIDWSTGVAANTSDAPPYVVLVPADPRFHLAGVRHAANLGLVVLAVNRPYRVVWASRGLETDGWTHPGRPATIRIYNPAGRTEHARVLITLTAPSSSSRYRISTASEMHTRRLSADAGITEDLLLCVPARSNTDVTITAWSRSRVKGPLLGPRSGPSRRVGVAVGPISVRRTRLGCERAAS